MYTSEILHLEIFVIKKDIFKNTPEDSRNNHGSADGTCDLKGKQMLSVV